MPLPSKILWFPLSSGAQEGVDPHTAKPGTVKLLKNGMWNKDGLVDKRFGTAFFTKNIVGGGVLSGIVRLATHGQELLATDGKTLFSYSPQATGWQAMGDVPEVGMTWETSLSASDGTLCADVGITSDGKRIEARVSGDPMLGGDHISFSNAATGVLYVTVYDQATGQVLTALNGTGAAVRLCRVLVNGTSWAVVYTDGTNVSLIKSDLSQVSLRTDGTTSEWQYCPMDACVVGSTIVYSYVQTALGTQNVVVASCTFAGGALVGPINVAANQHFVSVVAVRGTSGESLYVGFAFLDAVTIGATGSVRFAVHDPATLIQSVGPTVLDSGTDLSTGHMGIERIDATDAVVCWSVFKRAIPYSSASDNNYDGVTHSQPVTSGGALSVGKRGTMATRMISRPFTLGGSIYMLLADWTSCPDLLGLSVTAATITAKATGVYGQCNTYLAQVELTGTDILFGANPHRYVGRVDVIIGGNFCWGAAPGVAVVSGTEIVALTPFLQTEPVDASYALTGYRRVHVTTGASVPLGMWLGVEALGETHLAAARLTTYDGARTFDFGFPRPTFIGILSTFASSPGGTMVQGVYEYALIPTFYSAAGTTHRGPISPVVPITVADGGANHNQVLLGIVSQTLGGKLKPGVGGTKVVMPKTVVFRSEVGLGTLHQRSLEPDDLSLVNQPGVVPDKSTYDTEIDSIIGPSDIPLNALPLPYTVAELEDIPPPGLVDLHLHKGRLFGIAGNLREVWYTKDSTENPSFAPGWNPSARLVFDRRVTGLESLDDKLVIFADDTIFYTLGEGPASNGDGADYTPTKIQTDVGCSNPRSIVSTPDGIMFQSLRGIYILSRSLELQWIGKPVRDTLAAFPIVTSAVLVASLNQVRFTCNSADGTHGVVLAYDLVRGQWIVHEYSDGATSQTPIADAIVLGGTWHFVTPAGQVYKEDPTTHLDAGTWVTGDIEITDTFAEGPLGYQRVRRAYILGDLFTACDLTLKVAVNGLATYDETRTWTSAELANLGSGNVGIHIKTQKNASFRLRVTDAPPSSPGAVVGTGQGVSLSAFGFDIAPKKDMDKRPAAARK